MTGVLPRSLVRFFAGSLLGLMLDIGLAWTLLTRCHLSLVAAAAVSATVVAFALYFVHELWTFSEGHRQISAVRMLGTVLTAGLTLAVRSACLTATATLLGHHGAMPQLLVAAGLSFTVNYGVTRKLLGRRPPRLS